jgi:hypothetical protein
MATLLSCPSSFYSPASTPTSATALTFTQDQGTWIYCNFPESITSRSQFGNHVSGYGNVYLNQVSVNGTVQLFASHLNSYGSSFNYGVQLYNPNASSITVTILNNGFRASSDWLSVECGVWSDFFATPGGNQYIVGSGQSLWIIQKSVPSGALFNAVIRFQTTNTMYCTEYVYDPNVNNIDGTATLFPWDSSRVYRGHGNSYFIRATYDIYVSQMPYKFYTNICSDPQASSEMITIYDPSGTQFSCPGANLGNWGAQYYFTINVHNNTSSSATIQAYVGSDQSGGSAPSVMNLGGTVVYCGPGANQMWNWLQDTISANSTQQYIYQFIHAANASGPTRHDWRLGSS